MDNFNDPNRPTACQLYSDCTSEDKERRHRGYENLGDYLYRRAVRLTRAQEVADDLTQTALEKVWLNIDDLRSCKAFKTWATIILFNERNRLYRKEEKYQDLPDELSNEDSLRNAESSERAIERLFNASLARKSKWAWIGRLYYEIKPDQALADIENLLCKTSVQESTYYSARSKIKKRWPEMGLLDAWLEAEFWPVDPAEDDALDPTNDYHRAFQKLLQQLLATDQWNLLYQAPLDKGHLWAWIGLYIYEMSNEELARVENLLCSSHVESHRMTERRRDTQEALEAYLRQQSFRDI